MTLALINGMRGVLVACALMLATAVIGAQDFPNAVIVGGESTYVVRPGDTVTAIAGHFGMSASALIARGGVAVANPPYKDAFVGWVAEGTPPTRVAWHEATAGVHWWGACGNPPYAMPPRISAKWV